MPLCGSGSKKDVRAKRSKGQAMQKVLIPKGMINPGETTIIEIPARLHNQPLVIAKRKGGVSDPAYYTSDPINSKTNWHDYEDTIMCRDNCSQPGPSQQSRKQSWCSSGRDEQRPTSSSYREVNRPKSPSPTRYQQQQQQPQCISPTHSQAQSAEVDFDLERTEHEEQLALQRNLEEFQRARRRLLSSTSHIVAQNKIDRAKQNRTY